MCIRKVLLIVVMLYLAGCQATADDESGSVFSYGVEINSVDDDDADCPVGLVNDLPLDQEFGPGTAEITRCLQRQAIRVVYQINQSCKDETCAKPYALGNIQNAIKDYQITHGLKVGKDFKIVAIAYGAGYKLVLANDAVEPFAEENPFQEQVESLIAQGVQVYFCQNTSRGKGIVTANLIPGIEYVTSGVTAITDFQLMNYAYMQP